MGGRLCTADTTGEDDSDGRTLTVFDTACGHPYSECFADDSGQRPCGQCHQQDGASDCSSPRGDAQSDAPVDSSFIGISAVAPPIARNYGQMYPHPVSIADTSAGTYMPRWERPQAASALSNGIPGSNPSLGPMTRLQHQQPAWLPDDPTPYFAFTPSGQSESQLPQSGMCQMPVSRGIASPETGNVVHGGSTRSISPSAMQNQLTLSRPALPPKRHDQIRSLTPRRSRASPQEGSGRDSPRHIMTLSPGRQRAASPPREKQRTASPPRERESSCSQGRLRPVSPCRSRSPGRNHSNLFDSRASLPPNQTTNSSNQLRLSNDERSLELLGRRPLDVQRREPISELAQQPPTQRTQPTQQVANAGCLSQFPQLSSGGVPPVLQDLSRRLEHVLKLLAANPSTAVFVPEILNLFHEVKSVVAEESIKTPNASRADSIPPVVMPAMQQLEDNVKGLEALLASAAGPPQNVNARMSAVSRGVSVGSNAVAVAPAMQALVDNVRGLEALMAANGTNTGLNTPVLNDSRRLVGIVG